MSDRDSTEGGDRAEVEDLRARLLQAERLATVGLTAAGLAHTIKNILGGLEGAVYTVDTALERGDDARVELGWAMVRKYIEKVDALVWNLLRYANEQEPTRESVGPATLAREVFDLYVDKAELAGVSLQLDADEDVGDLWADPQVMHACLVNLVTNAIDACSWDPTEGKEHVVRIVVRGHDGGVRFEVEDNGPGIPEQSRSKILRQMVTTKGIRGTGLGLLMTKQAVEQHGGTIDFQTTPGEGTCFGVELPLGGPTSPRT